MTGETHSPGSRDRVRSHRARLRAEGLRPIQIRVPDTRSANFRAQAHRQSLAVARGPDAEPDQAFVDAVSDDNPDSRQRVDERIGRLSAPELVRLKRAVAVFLGQA